MGPGTTATVENLGTFGNNWARSLPTATVLRMPAMLLYITAPDRTQAVQIGRTLVEERLIACANVLDAAASIYWWEGQVREETEAVLIAKTDARNLEVVTARVCELHPYEMPCVVGVPIEAGNADYLNWVQRETVAWDDGRMG